MLVDGLDFSDDKMLVGRTLSYSDTQRYRVGPNCLQLPVNQARNARVATNQRDGLMTYCVDATGENPHVNYEPSITGGLREAEHPAHDEQGPVITGRLTRKRIERTNDCKQAGQRYCLMEQWERDDLVSNLTTALSRCDPPIQQRMVWHFLLVEEDLGLRVGEGLGIMPDGSHIDACVRLGLHRPRGEGPVGRCLTRPYAALPACDEPLSTAENARSPPCSQPCSGSGPVRPASRSVSLAEPEAKSLVYFCRLQSMIEFRA